LAIFNRIYIGSIFFELTDTEIGAVFSVFGPIKSVMMVLDPATKRHRGYGFIEFETPDAAALAQLNMDNAELGGRHIKVGRPNNFPSDLPPGVPRPLPNRIYVANVHELIQEDEIKAIFEAFGPLRHCNICPDPKSISQHRGYGYVEYEVVADAINAMNSLHNFELAGRQLKIGKSVVGGPIALGMKDAQILKKEVSDDEGSLSNTEIPVLNQIKLPSAVLRAAQQINATLASTSSSSRWSQGPKENTETPAVICMMTNLIEPEELENSQEAQELIEDITTECEKFGPLAEPIKIHTAASSGKVIVFVRYRNSSDCSFAIQKMDGRWFAGRQISAKSFQVDRYESQNFD
jgi:poly(U)-binding-splicing factor PUF60